MHTLSSASRTCIASASAVECTATQAMPSSLQARRTRRAISPRLAMRIFEIIGMGLLDDDEGFAVFNWSAILDENFGDLARARGGNLVHRLHGFDDQQCLAFLDHLPDLDEGRCAGS